MSTRFPDSEFRDASHIPLLVDHLRKAEMFRSLWLEDARAALAWPIKITSFVRVLSGTHNGSSVDVQPCRKCGDTVISEALFQRRLQMLYEWIGVNRPRSFGALIHERDHLHVTLSGFQSRTGIVLREPTEGVYIPESLRPVVAVAPVLLAGAVLFTLFKA